VSVWAFLLLCPVVLVGSLLQGAIGFGLGLIAAPVVAIIAPSLVPVVLLVLACVVTSTVLVLDGAHLDLRGTGWALVGRVPGTVGGAVLVAVLPAKPLALLVVLMVVVGVVASLRGFQPRPTRSAVVVAGAVSGLMGTATSIGGPPMAMVWQRFAGPRLRSTMGAFFLVGSALSLIALTVSGSVDFHTLRYALFLAPAAALGVVLARPVGKRLDVRRTRITAMALAVTGAGILLVRQFG
jgi:uncharacterized membrane protein YfcA